MTGGRRILIRLVVALVATSLLLAGVAAATRSGRNGSLVVTLNPAQGGGPDQIWLVDPGGRIASRRLPTGRLINIDPLSPRFLPSGRQLVFTAPQFVGSPFPTAVAVMIVSTSGSGLRQLGAAPVPAPDSTTFLALPGRLAVSPSGRTVAVAFVQLPRGRPKAARLLIDYFDVRRGRRTGSTSVAGIASLISFDWLPNGELLLVATNTSGRFVTEVVGVTGAVVRRTPLRLPPAATVTDAAPSPGGSAIAFTETVQQGQCGDQTEALCPSDVYTVAMAGGNPRRRTFTHSASSPVWSPDGRRLAFETAFGESDEVLTLATGRTHALVVRVPRGGVNLADWQPLGA